MISIPTLLLRCKLQQSHPYIARTCLWREAGLVLCSLVGLEAWDYLQWLPIEVEIWWKSILFGYLVLHFSFCGSMSPQVLRIFLHIIPSRSELYFHLLFPTCACVSFGTTSFALHLRCFTNFRYCTHHIWPPCHIYDHGQGGRILRRGWLDTGECYTIFLSCHNILHIMSCRRSGRPVLSMTLPWGRTTSPHDTFRDIDVVDERRKISHWYHIFTVISI